jgi:phage terminase small subunit
MTEKMKNFVDEYLKDFNATQAAIRAGYSKKTAHVIGIENLRKPVIKEAIDARVKELIPAREKIILRNLDFWADMMSKRGVKDGDKIKASELLGRYAAMFTDRIDLSGSVVIKDDIPKE